jgi:hypothetical protein
MQKSKICAAALVVAFACAPLFAVPPLSDPTSRVLRIEYPAPGAGEDFISSESEVDAVFPLPVEAFRAVLTDFVSYPRFFPRLEKTTVLESGAASALIRQQYSYRGLGYSIPAVYDLALSMDDSVLPSKWTLAWKLAGTDGKLVDSCGSWCLEDVGSPDEPATRVTHRNRSLVRKRVPMQDKLMRSATSRELSRLLVSVYNEARERESKMNRLALAR